MIARGHKSKPKKICRVSNKTQKNPWTKNEPPKNNVPADFHVEPHRSSDCLNEKPIQIPKIKAPPKYLANFPTQEDPGMENLKPKKVSPPRL